MKFVSPPFFVTILIKIRISIITIKFTTMKKPVIYQAVLEPLTEEEILKLTKGISIDERLGKNAYCPECGYNKWWLLPTQSVAVLTGGKPYCECLGCGYSTHL